MAQSHLNLPYPQSKWVEVGARALRFRGFFLPLSRLGTASFSAQTEGPGPLCPQLSTTLPVAPSTSSTSPPPALRSSSSLLAPLVLEQVVAVHHMGLPFSIPQADSWIPRVPDLKTDGLQVLDTNFFVSTDLVHKPVLKLMGSKTWGR